MVVYLDILFFINLIMNYIVLIVTSIFGGIFSSRAKIFLSAFLGAVYSVCIFLSGIDISFIINILFGIFMVFLTFGKRNLFKTTLLFFMINFMFAGSFIAIFYLSNNPSYMFINGIPYIDIDISLLISTFILCYIALCVSHKGLGKNKVLTDNTTDIYIKIQGKQLKISAFLDSGHSLFDILTGKPVIIVDAHYLYSIVPENLHFILSKNPIDALELVSGVENSLKIRLISFKSVGNSNGMMTIFTPDEIFDKKGNKINALIGVSLEKINLAGCFAIIGG